jgi:hypothetical protein
MEEIWKDIPWYEGLYQVSNLGEIKSFKNNRWGIGQENILKPQKNTSGYLQIILNKQTYRVHRLVMLAFIWESKLDVNHINWIKTDNRLENLEYCTRSENLKHSYRVLKRHHFHKGKFWENSFKAKKILQYSIKWIFIKEWGSMVDIQIKLWLQKSNICRVCKWQRNHTWGFVFRYKH